MPIDAVTTFDHVSRAIRSLPYSQPYHHTGIHCKVDQPIVTAYKPKVESGHSPNITQTLLSLTPHTHNLTPPVPLKNASIKASALSGDGRPRARASSFFSMKSCPRLFWPGFSDD